MVSCLRQNFHLFLSGQQHEIFYKVWRHLCVAILEWVRIAWPHSRVWINGKVIRDLSYIWLLIANWITVFQCLQFVVICSVMTGRAILILAVWQNWLFVVLTSVSVMTRHFCVGNVCVFLSLMTFIFLWAFKPPKINPQLTDMHVNEFSTHSNSLIGW